MPDVPLVAQSNIRKGCLIRRKPASEQPSSRSSNFVRVPLRAGGWVASTFPYRKDLRPWLRTPAQRRH
jgi:hypothetical protein